MSWFSNFLRTLVRKSWSTVSNSPGALCRISSSVAGLIPGERTSATPRSVLQISDRHLRRYPLRNDHRTWTIICLPSTYQLQHCNGFCRLGGKPTDVNLQEPPRDDGASRSGSHYLHLFTFARTLHIFYLTCIPTSKRWRVLPSLIHVAPQMPVVVSQLGTEGSHWVFFFFRKATALPAK